LSEFAASGGASNLFNLSRADCKSSFVAGALGAVVDPDADVGVTVFVIVGVADVPVLNVLPVLTVCAGVLVFTFVAFDVVVPGGGVSAAADGE
jgi:hypothetical protein